MEGGDVATPPSLPRPKPTKSVLFDSRSTTHSHTKKVTSVTDCWRCMVRGSNLVKVRPNGRTYNRFFALDDDLSCIRWVPTSKKTSKAFVAISAIREVRCVHASEVVDTSGGSAAVSAAASAVLTAAGSGAGGSGGVGSTMASGPSGSAGAGLGVGLTTGLGTGLVGGSSSSLDCTFSVIHGDDFASLDLIAASAEEANIWVIGLNALLGSQLGNALGETTLLRERWLRQVFHEAAVAAAGAATAASDDAAGDSGASGASVASGGATTPSTKAADDLQRIPVVDLDQDAAIALLKEINADLATGRIKQKMAEFDSMKSAEERGRINIHDFVTMFQEMATRPEIHFLLIRFANKDFLTAEDLKHFLECEQGMSRVTLERCLQLIGHFEPSTEARANNHLMLDGMTRLLLSDEGDIFDANHLTVQQDMTQPVAHYFISASHNTYLLEDQLRGPSSVEGYIRALQSGCRCVKIDVWDGSDPSSPVVCHGNTLTTKISFRDVVRVIADYAFEASRYPLFVHLENHCSIRQQLVVAHILEQTLGDALYIPSQYADVEMQTPLAALSPKDLIGKIILAGKTLANQAEEEGDVSDEDEGAETNRRRDKPRKARLCSRLSRLITLKRSGASKWPLIRDKHSEESRGSYSLNESAAARLLSGGAASWAEAAQRCLVRVFPNGSRVDSSNFSPLEFWNSGVQLVALNFQTPGLMMDLYDGKFRQNGGCGYVLKPAVMRQPGFVIPLAPKDVLPSTPPQLLRIRVISGQQLPRPRGSVAKATVVDPYVLIQIYGFPIDCAEKKTRTVLDESNCAIFEESLEFYIHHPEMALVRFVVLDDEFIGDDFIGQYTIPFECMRAGYRHVRLLSNLGEALDNATLFVHISFSEKWAGELLLNKRGKPVKKQLTVRMTGLKTVDEHLKSGVATLQEAARLRQGAALALLELRAECGLPVTANIKQCLRVLLQRLANCGDVSKCHLTAENNFPVFRLETLSGGYVPAAVHRTMVSLEKALLECELLMERSSNILDDFEENLEMLHKLYEQLDDMIVQACFKGKQVGRVYDVYGWNMALITNQWQLLAKCRQDCSLILDQVSTSDLTLASYVRPNAALSTPALSVGSAWNEGSSECSALAESPTHVNGSLANHIAASTAAPPASISLSRCTLDTTVSHPGVAAPKLKGILKKSADSAADLTALVDGYVVVVDAAEDDADAEFVDVCYGSRTPSPASPACSPTP